MSAINPVGETVWWIVRTIMTIVIGLLLVRAVIEYVPALAALPPAHALLNYWDPLMADALAPAGIPWSHQVRSFGLPGVAIALILLRTMLDDVFSAASRAPRAPASRSSLAAGGQPIPAPVPATATQPPQQAPASADAASDPNATMLKPQATATSTGTRFATASGPAAGPVTRIGRYDITAELGRGAMGTVYKGIDPTIGRTVAIKTISAVGSGPEVDEYRARFLVEARSAGRLNHPGIVSVYDVTDDDSGRPSLVLEFIDGVGLDKLLADKALTLGQIVDIVAQVARALAYAHGNGVVHRDVKPANVMITGDNQAKLSDFGVAKIDGTTMTVAGQVLGTPAYMSPEQCMGGEVDARSDIFSLGSVLYTATTGQRPFAGNTFTAVAYNVVHEMPNPPTRVKTGLPASLDRIIWRCLAKSPVERYPNALELAQDLDKLKTEL